MHRSTRSRSLSAYLAALLTVLIVIASTAAVEAKRPPKPPPTPTPSPTTPSSGGGSATIDIAASGTLEPNQVYLHVDVTVTCPVGWSWSSGSLYVRQADPGGAGSFSAACTGTPQVGRAKVVDGNNATPTGLIVYEVYLNGRFDQGIGGGYTQAILYVDAGVLNTIEVFAVDGAGNKSAPATVTVDMRF